MFGKGAPLTSRYSPAVGSCQRAAATVTLVADRSATSDLPAMPRSSSYTTSADNTVRCSPYYRLGGMGDGPLIEPLPWRKAGRKMRRAVGHCRSCGCRAFLAPVLPGQSLAETGVGNRQGPIDPRRARIFS